MFTNKSIELPIDPVFEGLKTEVDSDVFSILPNPVSSGDMVRVSGLTGPTLIDIIDSAGRLVYTDTIQNGLFKLPAILTQGLFYVFARDDENIDPLILIITD